MATNPEQAEILRQLRAARDGRFLCNEHGRYLIEGESRPDRKTREKLIGNGQITWRFRPTRGMELTEKGRRELEAWEAA